jgi:hypothetical protein
MARWQNVALNTELYCVIELRDLKELVVHAIKVIHIGWLRGLINERIDTPFRWEQIPNLDDLSFDVDFDIPKCAARLRLLPLNLRGFVVSFCSFYHELTDFLLGTCGFPFARWRREYPKGAGAVAETAGSSPTRIMTAAPMRKTSPPPKLRPNPRVQRQGPTERQHSNGQSDSYERFKTHHVQESYPRSMTPVSGANARNREEDRAVMERSITIYNGFQVSTRERIPSPEKCDI